MIGAFFDLGILCYLIVDTKLHSGQFKIGNGRTSYNSSLWVEYSTVSSRLLTTHGFVFFEKETTTHEFVNAGVRR